MYNKYKFINVLENLVSYCSDYMQRVELIQDLKFETATTKIKATPDGEFLFASGDLLLIIYPIFENCISGIFVENNIDQISVLKI